MYCRFFLEQYENSHIGRCDEVENSHVTFGVMCVHGVIPVRFAPLYTYCTIVMI